eukprot:6317092-Alexandrium_andersonii.AAC.1
MPLENLLAGAKAAMNPKGGRWPTMERGTYSSSLAKLRSKHERLGFSCPLRRTREEMEAAGLP